MLRKLGAFKINQSPFDRKQACRSVKHLTFL